jgi:hypothetical protein
MQYAIAKREPVMKKIQLIRDIEFIYLEIQHSNNKVFKKDLREKGNPYISSLFILNMRITEKNSIKRNKFN